MLANSHEHVDTPESMAEYLRIMDDLSIEHTVFVGSGNATIYQCKPHGFEGWQERNHALLTQNPDPSRLHVFPCLDPLDPDVYERFLEYLDRGAKGIKLYYGLGSCHSQGPWHTATLDNENMAPVFEEATARRTPILFHVNRVTFYEELLRFLEAYPGINVCVPHLMVSSKTRHRLDRVAALLERYPNVLTDLSNGREDHLVPFTQSITRRPESFRAFVNKYANQIMWGTDLVITQPKLHKMGSYVEDMTRWYRLLMETEEWEVTVDGQTYSGKGLALTREGNLYQIYRYTFDRWLAGGGMSVHIKQEELMTSHG